jgi:hypothetical protein
MSELNASNLKKEHGNEGPDLVGTTELTSPYFMVPPSGTTAERPQNPEPGTLRFNTDIGSLEYFKGDGLDWETISRTTPNLNGGARGVWMGGRTTGGGNVDVIEYCTISTLGNNIDFGNLTQTRRRSTSAASRIRQVLFGGSNPSGSAGYNVIDYITFSTTGNATDFGDQTTETRSPGSGGDSTRGIMGGGTNGYPSGTNHNVIEYITFASTGNTVDFGDLSQARDFPGTVNSSTRLIFGGGAVYPTAYNIIDYVTTSTTGNATDFGDLTTACSSAYACSCNSIRGIFGKVYEGGYLNSLEYVTMSTKGNTVDFGDLYHLSTSLQGASSPTRGVYGGGYTPGGYSNVMQYIQIMTLGNSVDFGDTTAPVASPGVCSNGHGGL